jgi:hypothetical protein
LTPAAKFVAESAAFVCELFLISVIWSVLRSSRVEFLFGFSQHAYRPYDDFFAIAPQVLAIVATCISWVWWITFVVSVVVMGLFQVFWCTRQSRVVLYGLVAAAGVCSASSLGLALHIAFAWRNKVWCDVWYMWTMDPLDDDQWDVDFYCPYIGWSVMAAVCGFLWGIAAHLMYYFVKSGRHAKWEEKHGKRSLLSLPNEEEFELSGVEDPSRKPEVV